MSGTLLRLYEIVRDRGDWITGREIAQEFVKRHGKRVSYGTLYIYLRHAEDAGKVITKHTTDSDGLVRWFRVPSGPPPMDTSAASSDAKRNMSTHTDKHTKSIPARKASEPTKTDTRPPATSKDAPAAKSQPQAAERKASPPERSTSRSSDTDASRERGYEIIDRLLAVLRAELDTDRLQGAQRNALVETVEQIVALRGQL